MVHSYFVTTILVKQHNMDFLCHDEAKQYSVTVFHSRKQLEAVIHDDIIFAIDSGLRTGLLPHFDCR